MDGEVLTVDSAAKAVEGLMSQQTSAPEGDAPERTEKPRDERGKFQAAKPEANSQESQEEPQEGAEEAQAEAEAGKAQDTQGAEQELPDTLDGLAEALGLSVDDLTGKLKAKIKLDGQETEVNLREALSGYSRDSDYRQKTAALAEQRSQLEQQQKAWAEERQGTASMMLGVLEAVQAKFLGAPPDRSLLQTDPHSYLVQKDEYDERMKLFQEAVGSVGQVQQQSRQATLEQQKAFAQAEAQKLVQKIPDLADEKKGPELRARVKSYLKSEGFTDDEIGRLADSRAAVMAWKASEYDRLQKAKPQVEKKVTGLPKFIKPGTSAGKAQGQRDALSQRIQRLKKSGSVDDAAAILKGIL